MAGAALHLHERIRPGQPRQGMFRDAAQSELKGVGNLVDWHDYFRNDEILRTSFAERVLSGVKPKPHTRPEDLYPSESSCKNVRVRSLFYQSNLVAHYAAPIVLLVWVHNSTDARASRLLSSSMRSCTYGNFPRRCAAARHHRKFATHPVRATSTCATESLRVGMRPSPRVGRPDRATPALGLPNACRSGRSHASAVFRKGGRA